MTKLAAISEAAVNPLKTLEKTIDILKPLLTDRGSQIALCVLFGSLARNQAAASSDVDLGVLFTTDIGLRPELDLQAELSLRLGCEVDLVDLRTAQP